MLARASSLQDRYVGCLLGLACGDAVGTTVEFAPRGSFPRVDDMIGGGPFDLEPGQWTDDTSMALCLAESLLYREGFDPVDQMNRYVNWWHHGYLSSTGRCFDIGGTTRQALARYLETSDPFSGSTSPYSAGNGSIMRLAPIPMFYFGDMNAITQYAAASSRTTHGAAEAVECCMLLAAILCRIFSKVGKGQLLSFTVEELREPAVSSLLTLRYSALSETEIKGTGYCVESLKAALWCFFATNTFRDAVLAAANLGDDADTTAAITGQIAGAYYGGASIPENWRKSLAMCDYIESQALRLHERQKGTKE